MKELDIVFRQWSLNKALRAVKEDLKGILYYVWAVVVAQFVQQLLLTPQICSSNPVIHNFIICQLYKKTKIKKKGWIWPNFVFLK